jgi:hypothetical protein
MIYSHKLTCFSLIALLCCLSGNTLQAQTPQYSNFAAVEIQVSELSSSYRFHTRLFGNEAVPSNSSQTRELRLGTGVLLMTQAAQGSIASVIFGVEGFDLPAASRYFQAQGINSRALPDSVLQATDHNGIRIGLVDSHQYDRLPVPDGSVQSAGESPIFLPLMLDEIHISVANLEVDSLFYSRLLGYSGQNQAGSLWYSIGPARLRLSQTPVGQTPGIQYIAILASNTDLEAAAEAVFAAGGIIETILPNGFSFWDPDGLRMLVRTTAMY